MSPEDDWISPMSPRYRNWISTNAAPLARGLIGRVESGMPKGDYVLEITQNGKLVFLVLTTFHKREVLINKKISSAWPSTAWISKKGVIFAQLSPIGSSQVVVSLIFVAWGT